MSEQPKADAVALLREARDELACYVEDAWPSDLRAFYPTLQNKWERDMDLCFRIDALLAAREVPHDR